jgi:hypothetical protein
VLFLNAEEFSRKFTRIFFSHMSLVGQYNVFFLKPISVTERKTITSNSTELASSDAQRLEVGERRTPLQVQGTS